jgi:hypothetical protein
VNTGAAKKWIMKPEKKPMITATTHRPKRPLAVSRDAKVINRSRACASAI